MAMLSLVLTLLAPALAQDPACLPLDPVESTRHAWEIWRGNGAAIALAPLEETWAARDRACAPPSPEQLGRMAQVAGTIANIAGLEAETERWYLRALGVAPDLPFGADLGSESRAVYEALRARPTPAPLVEAPPPQARPPWMASAAVGGAGLALAAVGGALWSSTLDGPFLDCTDAGYNFGDGGLRACDEALGGHVTGRWLGSVTLMALGGVGAASGAGLLVRASAQEAGVMLSVPW